MARALKTFRYSDGFHAWTVATTSRPKALAAWGVKRDLFRDGSAEEIDSGPDREAALKAPGELIERGLAVNVGKVTKASRPKAKASNAAARKRVDALEVRLADLDTAQAAETAALEARRAELDREVELLSRAHAKAREAVTTQLKAARAKLG